MQPALPILARRAEIEAALLAHQVVVIAGETGSGKTTQLPQILHALLPPSRRAIAHTQPRRLAARAVAARIAEEMAVPLGALVGYKVRFDDRTSAATRIKVMTDGTLLAELESDRTLAAYHAVIIDEAHERSLTIDFLLGYLRTLLPRRPDLKVIITSATIDLARFSAFFGGPAVAPIIEVSGRLFPVEVRYASDGVDPADPEGLSPEVIADAAESLLSPRLPEGDVLVFLPGEKEIRQSADALRRRVPNTDILPLYSRLTSQEQDRIFHPSGPRRVILATNIAETSLTVPRVRYVVDSGLARLTRYDPQRKVSRLPVEWVSKASAAQRSGRCGRVADGIAIRLGSRADFERRPDFTDPEIRRVSLAAVILQMKSLDLGPIDAFPFLDPPDPAAIRDGLDTLFELGALATPAAHAPLTDIGRRLARLPLDPRVGRMLLAAEHERAVGEVLTLAAALSIQDPRVRPAARADDADRAHLVFRDETSDFLTLLNLFDQYRHARDTLTAGPLQSWCRDHFLAFPRMREWAETRDHLADIAQDLGLSSGTSRDPATPERIHRALLPGLISNVACREGASMEYRGIRGNAVSLFPGSVLFAKAPKWIMAAEIVQTTRLYARTVARLEPDWLEELASHVLQRQLSDKHLDPDTAEPSAFERLSMSGVVIVPRRRVPLAPIDPAGARAIFIRDALAAALWRGPHPFLDANRATLDRAAQIAARLRRRDILAPLDALAAWFDARLPAHVNDPHTLAAALAPSVDRTPLDPRTLTLALDDAILPAARDDARRAADPARFPDALALPDPRNPASPPVLVLVPLRYAFSPGKDDDGLSATIALTDLPRLTPDRAAWLVPGLVEDLVLALLKSLPKARSDALRAAPPLPELAANCAHVLDFAAEPLPVALADALSALHAVRIDPAAFSLKALPTHLRLRVIVTDPDDPAAKPLADSRDLTALHAQLAPRIAKAVARRARRTFERDNITRWDFDLPDLIPPDPEHPDAPSGHPALIERDARISLTLLPSRDLAAIHTHRAVRRLFLLQCHDDIQHHLLAFSAWPEMVRHYAALGPESQLQDEVSLLIAERTFMHARELPRTRDAFDASLQEQWGRLPATSREICEMVAAILEPRAKIAHRLSGGTPRIWAASVADIREHAAYLMPRAFLALAPLDRLRHYPRYVLTLRERLLALREGGTTSETAALAAVAEPWKRFTAWVARAMAAHRTHLATSAADTPLADDPSPARDPKRPAKAPLPQARRAAPAVNLDAGEWAMQPAHLPPAVSDYRWALEEFRAALFAPSRPASAPTPESLRALWAKAEPAAR
ncbi:MAG: ATP-dependent RNA helicase HrpA [Planctomycetota bacterium]|nr:ATP-dependent RNA helicase HrpA [Planctomycetota bacterium]